MYFSLVDDVDNYILEKGTLVSFGQDENGIESVYAIDETTILNKIALTRLKNYFC